MTNLGMQGRSALVTGATGGIGRAIAEALAREGVNVVVTGRDARRGAEIAGRIRDLTGRHVEFVKADLGSVDGARTLARDALAAAGGRIDILVNNAAYILPAQSLLQTTPDQVDEALGINVKAPILLTAAVVPQMIERGAGVVINIGSIGGYIGSPIAALYGATKASLHSLTQSWAAELGPKGVRVNAVAPGPTVTELTTERRPVLDRFTADYPARRPGTAAEVADAVVFLASDKASYIHGVILPVDGGGLTR